jgi:hypothetical protein
MLSAIIDAADHRGLRETFASLSDAATDGFVREVLVADRSGSTDVAAIADEAGAKLIDAGDLSMVRACAAARQTWLLLLESGARLQAGWAPAAWRHIDQHGDRAGWFGLSLRRAGPVARIDEVRADIEARLFGRTRAEQGLLISRRHFEEQVASGVAVALPFRARPLRRIDARILIAPSLPVAD